MMAEAGPIRLLQLTDMHLSEDSAARLAGVTTDTTWRDVFALAQRHANRPHALLLTGDLTQDGSEAAYLRLREQVQTMSVPALVIPGNHDDPGVMQRCFASGLVQWSGHALFQDWLLIMLNSVVVGEPHGHLPAEELARMDRLLAEVPHRHALICLHHQPAAVGCRWLDAIGVDNGQALAERLLAHDTVRGVLCGHVHQEVDTKLAHLRMLASPSTCIQFRPGSDEFAIDARPPGYRWLTLKADGHIESGVCRLPEVPAELDAAIGGY
ncbi:3',5'-cyclic-AMP phosphodiesterase [Methylonatrum kenyense]|uniref:3',5'-cyclic-AMP phosphodiesterase n=1 Tax=Methylonatrum kenyense TaxID=455253 RepID=UPI0020C0B94E|nr:3',5'-cyclic-AMP phosphodiesterase [Methylonatrum kenyense]MCK8517050.1 3',5'-cyclic-AMP phosphodiesterase [Methylonatrum kenyense]